jgi:ADP-ribosylglycohydrolase
MNQTSDISVQDRVLGGLWGAVVGDALGVPVEFKSREEVRLNPVADMLGLGTHNQQAGTWSDDSSLLLCTVQSLLSQEFDTTDMGHKFLEWYREELWTPWGRVFDVGVATSHALSRIATGTLAEVAGGDGQYSNGNGSLMRILPIALRFAKTRTDALLDRIHRASAITHRHPRSCMACGLYALVVVELLAGIPAEDAFQKGLNNFRAYYSTDRPWSGELDYFQLLLAGDLAERPESEIDSSGYVIHTLTASLWCLLTTNNYEECVLKAVNLGGDTDTTGCVAGGLAGVTYGQGEVPARWINKLARKAELEALFLRFAELR